MPVSERLEVALSAAREAGRHTLKYFQADNYAVVDPIDGTQSFIAGVPLYSTLVGVERDRILAPLA